MSHEQHPSFSLGKLRFNSDKIPIQHKPHLISSLDKPPVPACDRSVCTAVRGAPPCRYSKEGWFGLGISRTLTRPTVTHT